MKMKNHGFLNWNSSKLEMGNEEMKRKIFVIIIQTLGGNKKNLLWIGFSIQLFRSKGFLKFLSLKRESKMNMDLGICGNVECGIKMGRLGNVVVFGPLLTLIHGEEKAVLWGK